MNMIYKLNIIYLKIKRHMMNMIYRLNIIYLKIRRHIFNNEHDIQTKYNLSKN